MTEVASRQQGGDEDQDYRGFLEDQEEQWGDSGLDEDSLMGGLEEEETQEDDFEEEFGQEGSDEDLEEEGQEERGESSEDILRRLTQTDPRAARGYRAMLNRMHENNRTTRELQGQILDIREELISTKEGANGPVEGQETPIQHELPDGITEAHIENFQAIAEHLGYVPRSELNQRDSEGAAATVVDRSIRRGIESYGESFGYFDEDGTPRINPEIQAQLDETQQRLTDLNKGGVTPLDLFRLAFPDKAPSTRQEKQPRRGGQRRGQRQQSPRQRSNRRPAANTVRRSTGSGASDVKIYRGYGKDDPSDVLDRAWILAKKQLSQP